MEFIISRTGLDWLRNTLDLFRDMLSRTTSTNSSQRYRVTIEDYAEHITTGPSIRLQKAPKRLTAVWVIGRSSSAVSRGTQATTNHFGASSLEVGLRFASTTSWDYISGIYTVHRVSHQAEQRGFPNLDTMAQDAINDGQKQLIIIMRGYDGWANGKVMVKWLLQWQPFIKIYVMVFQKTRGPNAVGGHPFATHYMSDSEPL